LKSLANDLIRKKKLTAYVEYFFDPKYRQDVDYIFKLRNAVLAKRPKARIQKTVVHLDSLRQSHKVVYPNWVACLVSVYKARNAERIVETGIEVTFCPVESRFVVLDGNHRLAALKAVYDDAQLVEIDLWVESR